jgi:hypothetical protein
VCVCVCVCVWLCVRGCVCARARVRCVFVCVCVRARVCVYLPWPRSWPRSLSLSLPWPRSLPPSLKHTHTHTPTHPHHRCPARGLSCAVCRDNRGLPVPAADNFWSMLSPTQIGRTLVKMAVRVRGFARPHRSANTYFEYVSYRLTSKYMCVLTRQMSGRCVRIETLLSSRGFYFFIFWLKFYHK